MTLLTALELTQALLWQESLLVVMAEQQLWVGPYGSTCDISLTALSSPQAHVCKWESVKTTFPAVNFCSLNKPCDLGMCFHYQNSVERRHITVSMTSHPGSY